MEKKSRFIANTYPVTSEGQAQQYIESARKKFWDARHNCYAFVIGKNNEIQRYSDDGEPQKTAGKPMLDVLLGEQVHNCLVIVTRYFGGILLGTGGLVRAYQQSAKEGLANSKIMEKKLGTGIHIICEYPDAGRIQRLADGEGVFVRNVLYGADVELDLLAEAAKKEMLIEKLTEITAERALIETTEEVWFGVAGGKVVETGD